MMKERLSRIVNHPSFVPVTVGIVSAGFGMGVGYVLGHRSSKTVHVIPAQAKELDYEELDRVLEAAEAEAKEIREANGEHDYDEEIVVPHSPPISDDERIAYGAEMVAKTLKREMTSTHKEEPVVVANTEFAANNEDWDLEKELASRNSNRPYVIHYDEYFANEMEDSGYIQMALTYYAGDDILVDQNDVPIYNHTNIVGVLKVDEQGRSVFGHGSKGDPETVYIRNDKTKAEYEISRDPAGYAEIRMGLELEGGGERAKRLAHSRVDKFRPDD
jgi:2-phospho-L-lactate guanylyltransferase (CobY/MobA/RfbA family)